jgi:hypothetical protein
VQDGTLAEQLGPHAERVLYDGTLRRGQTLSGDSSQLQSTPKQRRLAEAAAAAPQGNTAAPE